MVVHCCAAQLPVGVVADAGAAALSFDATVAAYDEDELAERWERGLALWPGVLPAVGPVPAADAVVSRVRDLARRLGAEPAAFAVRSVLTPTCGLAGSAPDRSREAAGTLRRAMEMLTETRAVLPR